MKALACAATVLIATSCGAAEVKRYKGGPLDGIGAYREPSVPDPSLIPAGDRAALTALRAAYQAGHPERAAAFLTSPDVALVEVNADGDPKDRPGAGKVSERKINTPYAVTTPFGSVRLEWVSGGKLYYISYIRLKDGKVASMTRMSETPMPVMVN